MGYQYRITIKKLALALLLILQIIFTEQQESCFLPDGKRQSTCTRLHHCNQFWSIVKQHNGRPPQDVAQNINAHICGASGLVCCPDNAVAVKPATTTSTIPPSTSEDSLLPRTAADLIALKNHPNFNLINEPSCGISTLNRIVGGVNAELKEFPWAVLLGYQLLDRFEWGCGGSLISKRYVLTAAHCITNDLTTVRLGEHTISTIMDCDEFNVCADPVQDIKIEKKIKHSLYKRVLGNRNDIALLKLESAADLTKNNVKTICLPTNEASDIEKVKLMKRPLVITGWGKIGAGGAADILQKAYVPYLESNDCVSRFAALPNIKIFHTYLCAGGHNKTDSCKGDSGGGISTFASIDGRPKMILYGVVSGGIKCEEANLVYPGIYTNLRYYLNWILDNMSQ